LRDQLSWHGDRSFEDQLFEPDQGAFRRAGVDGGDATRMPGSPRLEQIERLAATNFADDDTIRSKAQGRSHQFGHGHHPGARAQRHVVISAALELDRIFENDHAVAGRCHFMQQRVREKVSMPPGYYVQWGGEFENQQRALARLAVIVPFSFLVVFALLYTALFVPFTFYIDRFAYKRWQARQPGGGTAPTKKQ